MICIYQNIWYVLYGSYFDSCCRFPLQYVETQTKRLRFFGDNIVVLRWAHNRLQAFIWTKRSLGYWNKNITRPRWLNNWWEWGHLKHHRFWELTAPVNIYCGCTVLKPTGFCWYNLYPKKCAHVSLLCALGWLNTNRFYSCSSGRLFDATTAQVLWHVVKQITQPYWKRW